MASRRHSKAPVGKFCRSTAASPAGRYRQNLPGKPSSESDKGIVEKESQPRCSKATGQASANGGGFSLSFERESRTDPGRNLEVVDRTEAEPEDGPRVRLDWSATLALAGDLVRSYDTGVTLRQLFYRLVAAEILPNTRVAYQSLSHRTAKARREGVFPTLIDRTRSIHRFQTFAGPDDARRWLRRIYRRDRTEGQQVSIYIGIEKAGIVEQLESWFGDLGIPILALGGYTSQTYVDEIEEDVRGQDRPAVLIYAGDFDPSGEDIQRDFLERAACFDTVVRVALTPQQIEEHDLPEQMGKATDSRAGRFVARHGRLVQVELDALPPDVLRKLFEEAIGRFWDGDAFRAVRTRETDESTSLESAS